MVSPSNSFLSDNSSQTSLEKSTASSQKSQSDLSFLNLSKYSPLEPANLFPLLIGTLPSFPQDLQQLLFNEANNGTLLLNYPQDFVSLALTEQKQVLIETLVINQRLNKITRNFPPHYSFSFVSLQFSSRAQLSWELITWALKSLYKDRMTQSEKLLLSRLKEAFAMSISQADWQLILQGIIEIAKINNGWILLGELTQNYLPNLYVHNCMDPFTESQTIMIELDPLQYLQCAEDSCPLNPSDSQLWSAFQNFVGVFFSSNLNNFNWTSSMQISGQQSKNKKKRNTLPTINYNGPAIPGGKYGFAQFLQLCGNDPIFTKASLGKLSMMVQEAVTRKIIVYYKTLLVKNSEPISSLQ